MERLTQDELIVWAAYFRLKQELEEEAVRKATAQAKAKGR